MRAGRTFPSKVRRFGARLPDLVLFDDDTAIGADGAESSVATLTDTDVGSGTEDHVVGPTEGDTGAGTDIDTFLAQGNPQDNQPATGTDDAVVGLAESDTGAGTDAGEIRGWVLVASDAVPVSDAVTWTRRLPRVASDVVSLTSEVATSARTTFATAVDSVSGVSDAVVRQRIVPRAPSETLTTAEVIVLHVFFANRVVQEPFGYAPTVLADGPAGYWRLGETSGDAARDASVHTLDGAYKNSGNGVYSLGQTGLLVGDSNTAVQFDDSLDDYAVFTGAQGEYVSTPDSVPLSITGDIDVRLKFLPNDWNNFTADINGAFFLGKWAGPTEWLLAINTNRTLSLYWEPTGVFTGNFSATSTASVPVPSVGVPLWVRATLDVDNGAAGRTTTFYTSTDGSTWTPLGTPVTNAGVTSIFNGTSPVQIGGTSGYAPATFAGKIYAAEIRSGISGTIVGSPLFISTPTFTDTQGNTWTFINATRGASLSGAYLQIAHDPGFQVSTTGKLSVNFWLKASSFAGGDLIYKSSARLAGNKEWAIGELGDNLGLYAKIYASDGTVLAQAVASGGGFNVTGTRYHIVMVWDGFNLKLYSNGAVIASGTGVGNPASTFGPVWVGNSGIAVYDEISITGINFSLGQVRARFEAGMQPSTFDTLTRSQVLARAIADSCTTSESLQALRIKPRTSSDTISAATDVLGRVYVAIRNTSEVVSGTDIGRRLYSRVNFEIATAIDHAVPVGIHPRTGTDAVATTTDAVVTLRTRSGITADTISVSETAVVTHSVLARIVPDPLTLTEAITRSNGIFSRTASDTVHIGIDWAVDNFSVHVRAVAQSNSVSDVATGDRLRTRSVSDNVSGLSDAVVRAPFRPRAGAEFLPVLTDKITRHFVGTRIVPGVITVVDSATRKVVDKRGPSDALTALSEAPSKLCVHTRHAMELLYESFADGVDHAAGAPFHLPTFGPPLVTITSMTPKVSLVVPYNVVTVAVTFDRYVQAWVVRVGGHTPWEGSLVAQWSGAPRLSDSIQVDSAHLEGGSNDIRVYAQAVSGDWSGIKS